MICFRHRDIVPAVVLILFGGWVLWQTLEMSVLGAVFPRLAGIGMLLGGITLGLRAIFAAPASPVPEGQVLRPLLLMLVLLAWAILLPPIGFVPTSILGAIAVMFLSMEDPPALRGAVIQVVAVILRAAHSVEQTP